MEIMPARAVDNGIWIAASSQGTPAGFHKYLERSDSLLQEYGILQEHSVRK
jgi:hypothetical protein